MSQKFRKHPTQEELRSTFDYCPDRGVLIRKESGEPAGNYRARGYYQVNVFRQNWQGHRLIWIWCNGDIAEGLVIDHIDRNPRNNRIENLRIATPAQNCRNKRVRSDSVTGVRGINYYPATYRVYICPPGSKKMKMLGYYSTFEEALEVQKAAYGELAANDEFRSL